MSGKKSPKRTDDDDDDDSGSKAASASLSSLSAAMKKACVKFEKETEDADSSAFAGQFGKFLKSMGKD